MFIHRTSIYIKLGMICRLYDFTMRYLLFLLCTAVALAETVIAQSRKAYVTYHMYSSRTPLTSVACSDGANGLMTKYKVSTLARWFPNVGAASFAHWNSPECGSCYKLTHSNGKTIFITVVDMCGTQRGYAAHFDISPAAFRQLGGAAGVAAGSFSVTYQKVAAGQCPK